MLTSFFIFSSILCIGNFQLTNCFTVQVTSSPPRHDSSNYLEILASNTPLLDVRAPIEFVKGSFPNTHNIPLLNDQHRELIGTCYKEKGQDAAIALGHTLVNDNDNDNGTAGTGLKSELVQSWKDHIELYPNGYLYCFRGGLRSHMVQQWLQDAGVHYPLIIGGYKAMRSSLLLDLQVSLQSLPIVLIGGRTCSGKTIALTQLSRYIDLEGLANHRGSAFGAIARGDQPAQIDFENSIIIEFNKHRQSLSTLPVFMEDEGHRIGARTLPIPMHRPMANDFPLVILETPLQERVDICIQEYVQNPFLAFLVVGEHECNDNDNDNGINSEGDAHARIRNTFLGAVGRIQKGLQKRLGGTRNRGNDILGEFENAFDLFESSNASNVSGFRKPIQSLLEDYYDPMYDYQMSERQGEILFHGNMEELVKWAEDYRTTK
jgi:tRNA 2-selenouridine synthase